MEPRDRKRTRGEEQQLQEQSSGSPAEVPATAASPTGFQDLDYEALGLIFEKLAGDREARHSLRQACRAVAVSPAVNALICSITVFISSKGRFDVLDEEDVQRALDQLLRFPKAGRLRELTLVPNCTDDFSTPLHSFLSAALESEAVEEMLSCLTAFSMTVGISTWLFLGGHISHLLKHLTPCAPGSQTHIPCMIPPLLPG